MSRRIAPVIPHTGNGSRAWPIVVKLVTGLTERVVRWTTKVITTPSGYHSLDVISQVWIHGCKGSYLTRTLRDVPTQLKFLTQFSIEHILTKGKTVVDKIRAKARRLTPYYPSFVRSTIQFPPQRNSESDYEDALDELPRKKFEEQPTRRTDADIIAEAKDQPVKGEPVPTIIKIVNTQSANNKLKVAYTVNEVVRTAVMSDDPDNVIPLLRNTKETMRQFRLRNPDLTVEDESQLRELAEELGEDYVQKNFTKLLNHAKREKVNIPQFMEITDASLNRQFTDYQREVDAWLESQRQKTEITTQEAEYINRRYDSISTAKNRNPVKPVTRLKVEHGDMNSFWSKPGAQEVYKRWSDSRNGRLD